MTLNVGILIYPHAEVLDFSGPFEVFSTASRLAKQTEPFNVFLVGQTRQSVEARGGFVVTPNYSLSDHPKLDILIVAGGDHSLEMKNEILLKWVNAQAKTAQLVASVCTGAFLLASAGVLSTQSVTTHWEDANELKAIYPQLNVLVDQRWVQTDNVLTSAGISAGMDMSLHIVEHCVSLKLAIDTARQMDYHWQRNLSSGAGKTA